MKKLLAVLALCGAIAGCSSPEKSNSQTSSGDAKKSDGAAAGDAKAKPADGGQPDCGPDG